MGYLFMMSEVLEEQPSIYCEDQLISQRQLYVFGNFECFRRV